MTDRLTYLILLISYCCSTLCAHDRHVRHITVEDGLSSNAVYSITQDNLGRMWFGTIDGLHCYDGTNISVWRDHNVRNLGQVIYAIKENSGNHLWIGSEMGLAVFDLTKEKFISSPFEGNGIRIMSPVSDIIFDRNGNAWISTAGQGVFRYSPDTKETAHYAASWRINSDMVTCIFEDREGIVWSASPEGGLCRFDSDDNIFHSVNGSPEGTISIFEDSSRNFWIGCENGLYIYNRRSGDWKHIEIPHENKVFQIRQIVEHEPGYLLLASDEGLTKFNVSSGECTTFKADLKVADNLNDNYLHSLFVDKDHGLWIGTYFGGVNYIPPTFRRFSYHSNINSELPARIISVFAKADDGKVWIGSDDAGFFLWNRKENFFKNFNQSADKGPTYHNIHALLQDGEKLFIGMYMGGLDIFDLKTSEFKNYKGGQDANSLYSSSIYSIFRDRRGEIWIGTTRGLNRYRKETMDFERIFDLNHADVEYMFEDRSGYMYACSLNQGIFRHDPRTGEWKQFTTVSDKNSSDCGLPTYKIITGAEDNAGRLWFGTDGWGLMRFSPATQSFIREPLPASIRVINKILPDKDDLWITTSNGLYCYTPESGKIKKFDRSSGLQDNLPLPNSGIQLNDGTMLIGGVNGFNEFDPGKFVFESKSPDVIISELTLFNRRATVDGEDSPLSLAIPFSDRLVLDNRHSIFSLSVAVLSYVNPAQNSFIYKLDGFDPDWNQGPADGRVSYTNLPPGKYTFLVRASDGAGGWIEGSLAFPIEVLPPWWLSVPMIAAYVLAFMAALVLFYIRMKRKQSEELQLMTAKKDKELYQSKIDFFTHMVHEIRTPLTLILTPLENVMRSKRKVSDELPTLNVIARNGERLLSLVNKLMDFRKMEAGAVTVDLQPVDLRTILCDICRNFLPPAEAKGINVVTDIPDRRCTAIADADAVRHVIDNLLSNALKFTGDHIWIYLDDADQEMYHITVKDNGAGIRKEDQEKIFFPFYQVSETRPQDNIGTGIGLMLVKKYVGLMHGRIRLESMPGRGSSFSVSLPKAAVGDPPAAFRNDDTTDSIMEERPKEMESSKDRILVVEDNPELLGFIRDLFSDEFDVTCAANGKTAAEILSGHTFDIIVSDVMMPGMDGFELCRHVKTNLATSHIPVLLLTAKVEARDYVEGFENGADLYVSKPFSSDVLMAQVKGIIRIRKQLRRNFSNDPLSPADALVPNSRIDNDFLRRIEEIVMSHIADPDFNVDLLAKEIGISRTGLFTKLKGVAEMTPNAYIKRIRLNEAARLIREEGYRVNEACYGVGFVSRSHFARYFQEQFGVTPTEYKQR